MMEITASNSTRLKPRAARRIAGGSAQPPTLVSKGTQFVGFQNPTGGQLEKIDLKLPGQLGRVSWREILY